MVTIPPGLRPRYDKNDRLEDEMKTTIVLAVAGALTLSAQNPLSGDAKFFYGMVKAEVLRSAEPMPEVRSFGQLVGHVADAQYEFCGPAKGEKKESSVEKTAKTKADLVAAL